MKIIPDSNVIVAAFSSRGLCHSLFELCLDRYEIIISNHILSEIYRILYEKFKMPHEKVEAINDYLKEFCECMDYEKLENPICRDKDDDEILALARSTKADYIITGDKDLQVLKNFDSIPIVSPREFWDIARKEEKE
ncbi:MAG: putative toxin-antitoxin system toxin component, PIN family [bacterium]|nr:putative toxin-antitoxin system toxin component, PIN family [bacterium]